MKYDAEVATHIPAARAHGAAPMLSREALCVRLGTTSVDHSIGLT